MFFQKSIRCILNDFTNRFQEAALCKIISVRHIKRIKEFIGSYGHGIRHDIGQLLTVADYHGIESV